VCRIWSGFAKSMLTLITASAAQLGALAGFVGRSLAKRP
jgi:hypothetical protein